MEDLEILKGKVMAVLKAALLGTALTLAIMVPIVTAFYFWRPLSKRSAEMLWGLKVTLEIPANILADMGLHTNPYILNAILGAVLFALPTAFWQLLKGPTRPRSP